MGSNGTFDGNRDAMVEVLLGDVLPRGFRVRGVVQLVGTAGRPLTRQVPRGDDG